MASASETDDCKMVGPIIKDIRAYAQEKNKVVDERMVATERNTAFLTPQEEEWYQSVLETYRQEFGLKPRED